MSMLLMVVLIKASLAVTCYECSCSGKDCDNTSCEDPFNSDSAETCEGDLCHADKMELPGQFTYTNYTLTFNTFIFLKMFISLQNRWPTQLHDCLNRMGLIHAQEVRNCKQIARQHSFRSTGMSIWGNIFLVLRPCPQALNSGSRKLSVPYFGHFAKCGCSASSHVGV